MKTGSGLNSSYNAIYITGGICGIIVLAGVLADVVTGNITGGDLSALPQTAAARFEQLHYNRLQGLYNLDLLNILNQIILVPVYVALFKAHSERESGLSLLALTLFLLGTAIMVAGNAALPMLDLSEKYFSAASEAQKTIYASAGESLLVRGMHGSGGMFFGFLLPNIGGLIISVVMLRGRLFSRINSWLGITGNFLMIIYVILVTFVPGVEESATAFAMPGGLLLMVWMVLFTIRLFSVGKSINGPAIPE